MKRNFENTQQHLLKEWDYKKNNKLPNEFSPVSGQKVWWKCKKGHSWEALISNRVNGRNCPYCSGKKIGEDNNLLVLNPLLAKEWDYKKNTLNPNEVTPFSHHKVWWICPKNKKHNYIASILHRSGGTNCPYCAGKKIDETNSLETLYPSIAKEWHPTKNKNLTPNKVSSGSHKKVWWICPKNKKHNYITSVYHRSRGTNCPYCAGKKIDETNSLETLYPSIAKEWHPTKNKNLTSNKVSSGSEKKVWWICSKGHEWNAQIYSRTKLNTGCPYCKNRLVNNENNLQKLFPLLAKEWHPTKNKKKPEDFVFGSHEKAWWICKHGHEWEALIASRTIQNTGCPKCSIQTSRQEVLLYSELKFIFKDCKHRYKIKNKEIDIYIPQLNIGIEYDGSYYHKNKLKSDLEKNKLLHNFLKSLIRLREGDLDLISKYDIKVKKELSKDNINLLLKKILQFCSDDIKQKIKKYIKLKQFQNTELFNIIVSQLPAPPYEDSLANLYPKLKLEWDEEKNYPLSPELFKPGSHKKVSWKCKIGHSWDAIISSRVRGTGCPFCAGVKVDKTNSLETLYPKIAKEWHPTKNNDLTPSSVSTGSDKKVWWICSKFNNHIYKTSIYNRTKKGVGCTYCSGKKVDENNNLEKLYPELCLKVLNVYTKSGVKKEKKIMQQIGINSSYKLTVECRNCRNIITRQVIEHVQLIKKSSENIYICKNCRK